MNRVKHKEWFFCRLIKRPEEHMLLGIQAHATYGDFRARYYREDSQFNTAFGYSCYVRKFDNLYYVIMLANSNGTEPKLFFIHREDAIQCLQFIRTVAPENTTVQLGNAIIAGETITT